MRPMIAAAIASTILVFSSGTLEAYEPNALLRPELLAEMEREGSVTRVQLKNPRPVLVPGAELARTLTDRVFSELAPTLLVESLYLYDKPSYAAGRPWSEAERRELYNAVRALSTLAGIQYYSASRKTMRTFYESSAVVDGPDTKRPTADPVADVPPDQSELYARQKDLTFGDNIYRYSFYARPEELAFVQENLTAMNYGLVPILGKNRLRTVVLVADAGNFLVVYAASMAKAALLPGIEGKVRDSFSNRADAVYGWFAGRADGAFSRAAGL